MIPGCKIHANLGYPSGKRYNLEYLGDDDLLSCAGNTFQVLNMKTLEKSVIPGQNSRGVAAITIHPTLPLFAVAEKGEKPRILIYSYPEMEVKHTLEKGTERTYSDIQFSPQGDKLASVGNAPDYLLTVWDWKNGVITLHTKAFSQEVYRVCFSPNAPGRLCTSGMGHIRFWKMAKTFTGLKLQGDIGKFGNVDISDVTAFVELQDGRVISGSEDGHLLMWEGGFIQFQLAKKDGSPCHDGEIEFVALEGRKIISSGKDGWVRSWNLANFEYAEVSEEDPKVRIPPSDEVQVKGAHVAGMRRGKDHWLIQDKNGGLLKLSIPDFKIETISRFHAGGITGGFMSTKAHNMITCGEDGSIRCWDLLNKTEIFSKKLGAAASCIIPVPESLCKSENRILMGFADGVLRQFERRNKGFELVHVCKPHNVTILSVAISPDGTTLATAAEDKTIFFLDVKLGYTPIGFVKIKNGSCASSMSWGPDSKHLVVSAGTDIFQFPCPKTSDYPDEKERKTFEIELKTKSLQLNVSAKVAQQEAMKKEQAEEEKEKKQAEEGGDAKDEAAEKSAEEIEQKTIPDHVSFCKVRDDSKILVGLQPGNFESLKESGLLFNLDAKYSKVYLVSFADADSSESPDKPSIAAESVYVDLGVDFGIVKLISTSQSGKYLTFGSHSGKVQVRSKEDPSSKSFKLGLHDGDEGAITAACLTFDDKVLATCGRDGNFFIYNLSIEKALTQQEDPEMKAPAVVEEKLPGMGEGVDDITDSKIYSFEEAKLKKELDDKRTAAEKKKDAVRAEIVKLRTEFKKLLHANSLLPVSERIDRDAFEIDPELMGELRRKSEAKVQEVVDELAYQAEKVEVQLQKLKKRFFKNLLVEHIRLYGFRDKFVVTSFRVMDLTDQQKADIKMIHGLLKTELMKHGQPSQKLSLPQGVPGALDYKPGETLGTGNTGKDAEENKKIRESRENMMVELEAKKPDPHKPSPEDLKIMEHARANLGDFKLKSAPDYVVPASQRINTEKKRRQMLLVLDSVMKVKMQYNRKFLAMRNLKRTLTNNIKKDNEVVRAINSKLGIEEELWEPTVERDEWPEERDLVTDDDLEEFKRVLAARAKAKAGAGSGFGGGDDDEDEKEEVKKTPRENVAKLSRREKEIQAYIEKTGYPEVDETTKNRQRLNTMLLTVKRQRIKHRINEAVKAFDKALRKLRVEKVRLDVDLKATDLRMLTLSEELKLLQKFEATENEMLDKRNKAMKSIKDIEQNMKQCSTTLKERKTAAETCLEEQKKIQSSFDEILEHHLPKDESGLKDSMRNTLKRIFNKKIKRKRPKEDRGESEEEDSDEDSSESEDSEDQDVCPADCPTHVFDKILDLRETKTDREEEMMAIKKACADEEQKFKSLELKVAQVQKELAKSEHELELFQLKKQKALNQIKMRIPLKLSQIKYVDDGSMPEDIGQALVFTLEQKQSLAHNLAKVKMEQQMLADRLSKLKKQYRVLKNDLKNKEKQIEKEEETMKDVMVLKFGREIDLKILRSSGIDSELVEMQTKLSETEEANHKALQEWDVKIRLARERLSHVVRQNTISLERMELLKKSQFSLEEKLTETSKQPGQTKDPKLESFKLEKSEMLKLVKMQEAEINALKAEIHVLSMKGGDVFNVSTNR
mmetsp:Transcript_9196/g.18000  ORF Transcript_9196/g.18000 Transcript_9196/m.18000 type:complete len:1645 (+) Transcript_9196:104-5038(+)